MLKILASTLALCTLLSGCIVIADDRPRHPRRPDRYGSAMTAPVQPVGIAVPT
ncbi:hypothetical protein BH10PSE18_BH10PSE18_17780 [soil metagenome]